MKINEAFIAQKKRKIAELETQKNIIEERKNKAEIEIEDINTLLVINNEQLLGLFEEANLSKTAKNKFIRLIFQKALVLFSASLLSFKSFKISLSGKQLIPPP